MTFIAGLLMSYIFISIIIISFNSVDTGLKFSSGQLTAILVSIGFVAAIISSFNYNDVSKFWPGPELHLIYRILLFIPCLYTYLINFIKDEIEYHYNLKLDDRFKNNIILGIIVNFLSTSNEKLLSEDKIRFLKFIFLI